MAIPLVVGVDGSEASVETVDWAADEAVRHGVRLHLLHAATADHEASGVISAASQRAVTGCDARRHLRGHGEGKAIVVARAGVFGAMSKEHRDRLMSLARDVSFATGERIFDEGGKADRFWVIHTGTVALDLRVPGQRAAVIETLGAGRLLGWSWLVPPHHWHLGAEASSPVRAYEFDAAAVREMCAQDPVLDHELCTYVIGVLARRLRSARVRLLDLYAPHGAGEVP